MSHAALSTPRTLQSSITQRDLELEVTQCVGGVLSPLLANLALSVLDEHFQRKWDAFSIGTKFPGQRRNRHRKKGGAVYKIVRYADDFVILVGGQRHHAEGLWDEVARILAPMGLSLSAEKTRVVHIDDGFDFLGWRIQRRHKAGTVAKKMVYTYPSKKSLNTIIGKVRAITRRSGSPYVSLEQLLIHLNTVARGWCNYFRHGVSAATYRYLYLYMWKSVVKWLRARHPKLGWRKIQSRFLTGYPAHRPAENGTVLYNPQEINIERYRWRGYAIPTPWANLAKRLDTAQQA